MKKEKDNKTKLPLRFIAPIKRFLESELLKLKRTEKKLKKADPFNSSERASENSLEEDVDEQIGHFDTEVKVKFLRRQIIQMRKALTRMKIGKYGTCESCGKMIDTDRLAAQPEATKCIKCSEKSEE